ncbi:hypothetical protein [Variovorax sp. GT1P44]|uniref:hypothetical protein n=1 Tax=Variovorax sp. GT1P44 TaxID=3443742 RepID=UPI003F4846FE
MKKVISTLALAVAALTALPAMAQWHNSSQFDRDLHACDRRGVNFERCMWDRGWQRGNGHRWVRRGHQQHWQSPPHHWQSPPPHHWHQPPPPPRRNQPRLSDMQQRALDNCRLLPPAEQPRCRATVMSTVGR